MYAKIVVVDVWHGFSEEIYCDIEHLMFSSFLVLVFPTTYMEDYSQFLRTNATNLWIYHAY